ncbi:MAG: DNA repair protein RadC [Chloroflexota bacterium]
MKRQLREMGIGALGAVPWGTHVCLFYDTKEDLLETLVPYFKAGLENNEFCMWVFSESLNKQECNRAMQTAVADFARYQRKHQLEIIPYREWYLKGGVLDLQRVLDAWMDKLQRAVEAGYDGMRITGDTTWLGKRDKRRFAEYEAEVNNVITKYNMLAFCTYSVSHYTASEVLNVMLNHQLTLFRRGSTLVLRETMAGKEVAAPITVEKSLTKLQKRFAMSGFKGLDDEDIIEVVLSLCLAPEESRRLAQESIKEFHSFRGFMSASARALERIGIVPQCMFFIELLHQLPAELLRQKIIDKPACPSSHEVFDYLYYSMQDLKKEVLKVIYLDNRNHIIEVADLFIGSADSAPIRPREIVESAINANATCLIFVHNHPSGDPVPSRNDGRLTRDLVFMGMLMQIKVLDHIVIGANKYYSFADEGLIQKYEDEFLNLKIRLQLKSDS